MKTGSILAAIGLGGLSIASSLPVLLASCALMGIGVGSVYNGCVATSVRVFPARRGLVAGVVAAGYGAGSLFTVGTIERMIREQG